MTVLDKRISFRDEVKSNAKVLLTFETVPPSVEVGNDKVITDDYIQGRVFDLVSRLGNELNHVSAFLIPEISKDGRIYADSRRYGEMLRRYSSIDLAVFRVSVAEPEEIQRRWLEESLRRGFIDIITVGGESSLITYNGPSPTQFMAIANEHSSDFFLGAVCIPSRGKLPRNGSANFIFDVTLEPRKMMQKQKAGARYHVTQIQYEVEHLESMIDTYMRLCEEQGLDPKRIFIGVTPILDAKNLNYLVKSLEVAVPAELIERLGVCENCYSAQCSIQQIVEFLPDFIERMQLKYPKLKLGVYVESIRFSGLGAYVDLFGKLRERLNYHTPQPL